MSSTLSAQEMAAHAAAFSQIKGRDLTAPEMLHIAQMHDGEANMAAAPELAAIPSNVGASDPALAGIPAPAAPAPAPAPPALAPIPQGADSAAASPAATMSAAEPPPGAPDLQAVPAASYVPGSTRSLAQKDDAMGDDLARQADRKTQLAEAYTNAAQQMDQQGTTELAKAQVEQSKANAIEFDKLSAEHAKAETRLTDILAQADATAKAQEQKVRVASDAAQSFEMRDFFADKSTVGKVFAIISQVLAGGANYLAGQPGAPTPLDKIIADDLQKQQARLGQLNRSADREKDVLEQAYKATGSRIAADAAITDAAYGKVDAAIKATAARMNTPVAIANAQKASAAIMQKQAELYQKSADALRDDAIKSSGQASKAFTDVSELKQKQAELAYKMKHDNLADNIQLEDVSTPQGMPNSYKERIQKDVLTPAANTLDLINDLKRTAGDASLDPLHRYLSVKQNQADLTNVLKEAKKMGANFSPMEKDLVDSLSGGTSLQRIAQLSTSPEYKNALTALEYRIKLSVGNSLGYRGVHIREGSRFAPKTAEPLPVAPTQAGGGV